jgi:dipeptidyl aminopeptidase/acylaminoacyl peptidase
MKALPRLWPAVIAACLLPACGENSRDQTNPFAAAATTAPPPSSAALVFTSSLYSLTAGAGREIFAANADGGGVTRLTYCNQASACDYVEAAPAPDRERVGARRVSVDSNGDGRVDEADGAGLVFVDLRRGVESLLVPASRRVSGVDWAPSTADFFIYSALPGGGGNEDLFVIQYNGTEDRALTCALNSATPCDVAIRERRPRLDNLESQAVYQRVDAAGASQIALFANSATQVALTSGTNDADPAFSPDNRRVAFRRLTSATANDGQGSWDIVTVAVDGTGLQTVQSGPAYRGAPDWGPSGLVWVEADDTGKRLVVTAADGSAPRAIMTLQPSVSLTNPRWLKAK